MSYGDYPDLSRVKKILVIKLRHLGDVLLSSAVFHALKTALPQSSLDVLVYKEAYEILEGHPAIQKILLFDSAWKNNWLKEIRFIQKIRKNSYDLVLNLTEGDRGAILSKLSRAKIRVGFDSGGRGVWEKEKFYTHVVKKCHTLRHMVERDLDAIRRIGIHPLPEDRKLIFSIPEEAYTNMDSRLKGLPKDFFLIHPTSRWRFKCWPIAKVKELILHLLKREKAVVLASGKDPVELTMVEELTTGISHPLFLNLAGKTSLKEFGALIERCYCLICVDSVSFHIASALKHKVVALFGPTSDVTWGPWQNPLAKVVTQPFSCRPCFQDGCGGGKISDCLQTLSVGRVLEALDIPVFLHNLKFSPK